MEERELLNACNCLPAHIPTVLILDKRTHEHGGLAQLLRNRHGGLHGAENEGGGVWDLVLVIMIANVHACGGMEGE